MSYPTWLLVVLAGLGLNIGQVSAQIAPAAQSPSTRPATAPSSANPRYVSALRDWVRQSRQVDAWEHELIGGFTLTESQRSEIAAAYQVIESYYTGLEKMLDEGKPPRLQELLDKGYADAASKVIRVLGPQAAGLTNRSPKVDYCRVAITICSNLLDTGLTEEQFVRVQESLKPIFSAVAAAPASYPRGQAEHEALASTLNQKMATAVRDLRSILSERQQAILFNRMRFLTQIR